MARGWYGLPCWNGLSLAQRRRLITYGNLPWGYEAEGECDRPAEVEVTTIFDAAPGPRFYCRACAIEFLEKISAPDLTTAEGERIVGGVEGRTRDKEERKWLQSDRSPSCGS